MGDIQTKDCDVCGILKAKACSITIGIQNADAVTLAEFKAEVPRQIDLCDKCLQRLGRYLARGTTPPKKRKAKDAGAE